jgi:hypothetical protein
MNNSIDLEEILLAFYRIGLAMKYEKKPPDIKRSVEVG